MANIQPVTLNDPQAIEKVNEAILQANRIDALNDAINAEASARSQEIAASINEEALSREIEDDIRPTFSQVSMMGSRPGDSPDIFCSSLDGDAGGVSELAASVAVNSSGSVVEIVGAGKVATRRCYRLEPGRQYQIRFVVQRSADTDDPANDAIRLGVRWLNKNKVGLLTTHLSNLMDVLVSSGRLNYQFTVALTDADNVDAVPPGIETVYFRPFVQTFGDGTTAIEVIDVVDLSLASDWSPDVTEYRREVAGLQQRLAEALDRIQALEGLN